MIGGGLHDPEPDRNQIVSQRQIRGAQREWAFWFAMAFGVWAATQGQLATALLFVLLIVTVPSVLFLWSQAKGQYNDAKEKGFWR